MVYNLLFNNIVLIIQKNSKLHMLIDFRNLNNATLKNEYPMLITNILVDSAAGNAILTFMDDYFGCN